MYARELSFASAVLDYHLERHPCNEAARRFVEAEATYMACIRPRDPRGARRRRACACWTGRTSHTRETRWYVVPVYSRVRSGFAGAQATSGQSRGGRTMGSDHDAPSALLRTTISAISVVLPSSISRDSPVLLPHPISAVAVAAVPLMSATTRRFSRDPVASSSGWEYIERADVRTRGDLSNR